jgi:hypothetical protein
MSREKLVGFLLTGLVVAALAAGGYWLLQRTAPEICHICQRQIHAVARAVIAEDGKREPVCCARCAFTRQVQQHKPIRLVEVTDYISGRPLAPDAAYYVEGSRVILCERHEPLLDESKQPFARVFDRCVPSLYAFARREDAEAFAGREGGRVLRLAELLEEVEPRP